MGSRMKQLMQLPKIDHLLKFPDSQREDPNSSWYLVQSCAPCIHILQLEVAWDTELARETCQLCLQYLIQCPSRVVDCQAVQDQGHGICVYVTTASGALYYVPLLPAPKKDAAGLHREEQMDWSATSSSPKVRCGSRGNTPQTITANQSHMIHIDVTPPDSTHILPTAIVTLTQVKEGWLVKVFHKDAVLQDREHQAPAFSFTVPKYALCSGSATADQKPLLYCVHTPEMEYADVDNAHSLLVVPDLFKSLFSEDVFLYKTPVILLAFLSGHIVWFPLKVAAPCRQQWQLLVDITDVPVAIHALNITPLKQTEGPDPQALVIVARTGRTTLLTTSQQGHIAHQDTHFKGPIISTLLMSRKLLYSTGKEVCCVHFDKDVKKNQWEVTRWKYGGIVHMSSISQPASRPPLADFQFLVATSLGVLAALTLDQAGESQDKAAQTTGQDLKDLLTSIMSTSESMVACQETLKRQDRALEQLSVAASMCCAIHDQGTEEQPGGSKAEHRGAPLLVNVAVQINPSSNTPEDKYHVVLKITNQSTVVCVGWQISITLTATLPTLIPTATTRTMPLPELCKGQYTEVAMPLGDLPLQGCPIKVMPCLVLHLDPDVRRNQETETSSAKVDTVHIPLPVTVLDVLDFMRPVTSDTGSRVQCSGKATLLETIASLGKGRGAAEDEGKTLEVLNTPAVSSLAVNCGGGKNTEKSLKQLVAGPGMYPHWQGQNLKMGSAGGRQVQLSVADIGQTTPGHWLVKIQAPQLCLLVQLRLAVADRLRKSPWTSLPLLRQGKDLSKLKDLQRQVEELGEGRIEDGQLMTSLTEVYTALRQLPVAQATI